ncbi:PIN domain-containing protein [Kyrpidia tusciae]|uniref:PilT protein domain protein n=1 Tax=Kyrpidia tusciae (strain DSM 2912 / NBRC 15312 / T2) TaxID=562970 RepID=D5WRS9_KYRT2|nr:PIN domain-containing protein [Kyrpidia tusciae]ADG06881.1 PilT protein domain protein [Kyrpidia tusciae DSM 2912]
MAEHYWIDTNFFLRLITGDPKEMSRDAWELVSLVDRGELKLRASSIVVAECIWVLESVYEYQAEQIAAALRKYVTSDVIDFEDKQVIEGALEDYERQGVDYIDAFVARKARLSPHPRVITWDRDFRRLDVEWSRPSEVVQRIRRKPRGTE